MHTHSEVVSIVNEVIETLNERESGYRLAAEHVKDAAVAGVFNEYMAQSTRFISELMPFSDEASPKDIGKGPLGTIYQGWMNLKEKISGYNTKSILGDCFNGEEAAVKVYEGALKDEELPVDFKNIIERQYGEIKAAKEKIKTLKEGF
jgi:uncharacterized protein (TIGR02284 family)